MESLKKLASQYKPQTTKQWIVTSCVGLAISTTVLITTLCIRAKRISKKQIKPLPSTNELSKINGTYFTRPSDGKKMEYFSLNSGTAKKAIIIFHGSMGTGYLWSHWRKNKILPILQKNDIQLITPSMPGHGASEPMRLKDPKKLLNNMCNDMISLLNDLKVKEVYIGGISYGSEPAFYLTQKILQSTENIKVKTVSCICGIPWNTTSFDFTANQNRGWFINFFSKLFSTPILLEFMAVYVLSSMMSGDGLLKQSLPKEQYERMKDIANDMEYDLKRGFEYFYDGLAIASTFNSLQKINDINTDYAFFNTRDDVVVNFHYGDQDTDVPISSRKFIMDKIPKGKFFEYKGIHVEVPLVEAIEKMILRAK